MLSSLTGFLCGGGQMTNEKLCHMVQRQSHEAQCKTSELVVDCNASDLDVATAQKIYTISSFKVGTKE